MCAKKYRFAGYFSRSEIDSHNYLLGNFKNKNVNHKVVHYKNGDFTWQIDFNTDEERDSFLVLARLKGMKFKKIY